MKRGSDSHRPLQNFIIMLSCKFIIPYEKLENLNSFLDEIELYNVSIFENADFGFSHTLDENGFPIAKFFEVEVFVNDKNEAENLQKTSFKRLTSPRKDGIVYRLCQSGRSFAAHNGV